MGTDNYTTYKCHMCGKDQPIDHVHHIRKIEDGHYSGNIWLCRRCIRRDSYPPECEDCGDGEATLYVIMGTTLCGRCLTKKMTVQDVLKDGIAVHLGRHRLGTDELEEESYAQEWWKSLAEGGA